MCFSTKPLLFGNCACLIFCLVQVPKVFMPKPWDGMVLSWEWRNAVALMFVGLWLRTKWEGRAGAGCLAWGGGLPPVL